MLLIGNRLVVELYVHLQCTITIWMHYYIKLYNMNAALKYLACKLVMV